MTLTWRCQRLSEIDGLVLLQALKLRQDVFIFEQSGRTSDIDAMDRRAWHVCGLDAAAEVQAYCRVLGGSAGEPWRIQRVVVAEPRRRQGLGRDLLRQAVALAERHGARVIELSAQHYAKALYETLEFVEISGVYDDNGIPHVKMSKVLHSR